MLEWKWTCGPPSEKSVKSPKKTQPVQKSNDVLAQVQSLNTEEETWATWHSENKREDAYAKMAEREMVGHGGRNPFMAEHSYADDVNTQVTFLTPRNTNDEEK